MRHKGFQLPARKLQHHAGLLGNIRKLAQHRDAQITRRHDVITRGIKHLGEQHRGGCLALGAGDPRIEFTGTCLYKEAALHLNAGPRFLRQGQVRRIQRHGGIAQHEIGMAKVRVLMPPQHVAQRQAFQFSQRRAQRLLIPEVRHRNRCALRRQVLCHADAAPMQAQPHDHGATTGKESLGTLQTVARTRSFHAVSTMSAPTAAKRARNNPGLPLRKPLPNLANGPDQSKIPSP